MERRTFANPAINDSATFIKTSAETEGEYTLIEIDLGKSDGPPLHYHNAFSETFEVREGVLYLQAGKEKRKLNIGESFTVPVGTPHRFYNEVDNRVKFHITLQPGHTGMENFIKIIYGLASDVSLIKRENLQTFHTSRLPCKYQIQIHQAGCHYFLPLFVVQPNELKKMELKNGY